jgi:hypothetical protein
LGLAFFVTIQLKTQPYLEYNMNMVENLSLFISIGTFFCGYFTYESLGFNNSTRTFASVIALLLQLVYFFLVARVFHQMYSDAIARAAAKLKRYEGLRKGQADAEGSGFAKIGLMLQSKIQRTLSNLSSMNISSARRPTKVDDQEKKQEVFSGVVPEMEIEDFLDQTIPGWKVRIDALTRFSKAEYSSENIEFWLAVTEFRQAAGARRLELWEKSPQLDEKLIPTVVKICGDFVKADDDMKVEVNLPGRLSTPIIEAVESKNPEAFTAHMLDEARLEIQKLMDRDSYQRFKDSEIWVSPI